MQRDDDPRTGRFSTPDPLSLQAGLDLGYADRMAGGNAYAYVSANPLTQTDPQGLYEEDVHYYTTFFLALVAGVDYPEAKIIALADQYVDDNPDTWPLDPDHMVTSYLQAPKEAMHRLAAYHFTQDGYDPPGPTPTQGTSLSDADQLAYEHTRILNPSNPQLQNLMNASNNAPTRCGQLQFFGEYLHAFEDAFGHRGWHNNPIGVNEGFGHLVYGHEPDKTYNDPMVWSAFPLALGSWLNREDRTLEMEKEVFEKMGNFAKPEANPVSWGEVESVMRSFNAIKENAEKDGDADKTDNGVKFSQKLIKLNTYLEKKGITRPDGSGVDFSEKIQNAGEGYPEVGAAQEAVDNRKKFLCDKKGKRLSQKDYPGTILPKDTIPCE